MPDDSGMRLVLRAQDRSLRWRLKAAFRSQPERRLQAPAWVLQEIVCPVLHRREKNACQKARRVLRYLHLYVNRRKQREFRRRAGILRCLPFITRV